MAIMMSGMRYQKREIPVTISGNGNSSYCYAEIDGVKYAASSSTGTLEATVYAGDVITFYLSTSKPDEYDVDYSLVIDGETIRSSNGTRNWAVPKEVHSISIVQRYSVSTASGSGENEVTVTTT